MTTTRKRFRVGGAKLIENKAKKSGPYANAGLSKVCKPLLEGMAPGGEPRFIPLPLVPDGDYKKLSSNVTGYLASM